MHDGNRSDLCAVSQAGKFLHCFLRLDWQTVQLSDHELHHIISVTLGVDAVQIPKPSRTVVIEGE